MRFSLQDVRKSVQRREGELFVTLHFLRAQALHMEIERLIAYHERYVGQARKMFSLDEARACIGEYRLANCLIASLSHWYSWRQREWRDVLQEMEGEVGDLASSVQLRLALYSYVNAQHQGFLDAQGRLEALQAFAETYSMSSSDLEYLLVLDSEDEALLTRETADPPSVQDVITLYNQWVFEAALFNASSVQLLIDCNVFASTLPDQRIAAETRIGAGVGAVIKRLCYLARRLGVYYDLAYEEAAAEGGLVKQGIPLLTLTLYGPQEVTGAPQQYGMRLARLCRLLLGYGVSRSDAGKTAKKASFSTAVIKAEARVHFLQRAYTFVMDANLLQLLPPVAEEGHIEGRGNLDGGQLFDSSIEKTFSGAFVGSAQSQGVDGWRLEREPEPLLLEHSLFIPDFAVTRDQQRIYVEILGFWTPAYRERKIQKLQQLRSRNDLLLAIPLEAKEAFNSIAHSFPIVYYQGQLSLTDVLHVLRSRYDDFAERLEHVDLAAIRALVSQEGLVRESVCYSLLHCYRRSELQQAAERVCAVEDIAFVAGIGLYTRQWMEQVKQSSLLWLRKVQTVRLEEAVAEIKRRWPVLLVCEDTTVETLLGLWVEVRIQRDSIFDAVVEVVERMESGEEEANGMATVETVVKEQTSKKIVKERRAVTKKRPGGEVEMIQGDLWG